MENVTQQVGNDQKRIIRMKQIASRMVGMYRLIDEQTEQPQLFQTVVKDPVKTKSSKHRAWTKFKTIAMDVLQEMLLDEAKMRKLIKANSKDRQGVSSLLQLNTNAIPAHSISIRMGFIMQEAVKRYVALNTEPLPKEVWESFKEYTNKGIQWDLSFKKGNTVFIMETKYNLNLDTEKTEKVVEKLDTFSIFLKKYYKDPSIKTVVSLTSLFYPTADSVPEKDLKPSLLAVKDSYLLGYAELFSLFGLKVSDKMWRSLHNAISKEIKKTYKKAVSKYKNI